MGEWEDRILQPGDTIVNSEGIDILLTAVRPIRGGVVLEGDFGKILSRHFKAVLLPEANPPAKLVQNWMVEGLFLDWIVFGLHRFAVVVLRRKPNGDVNSDAAYEEALARMYEVAGWEKNGWSKGPV